MNWQPIETAPKDETAILVWDGSDVSIAEYYPLLQQWLGMAEGRMAYCGTEDFVTVEPTHWTPLPDPPK